MKTYRHSAASPRPTALALLATLALTLCVWPSSSAATQDAATAAAQQEEPLRDTQTREEEQLRGKLSEALSKGYSAETDKMLLEATAKKNPQAMMMGAAAPASGSVFYEQISACGFYPAETRLECVINIKRNGGYGGPIETRGSVEYVEFCIDWDGNGFQSTDSVGRGHVVMHDGAAGTRYAVYRDFEVPSTFRTRSAPVGTAATVTNAPLLRARAILSWQMPPTGCNFSPIWGNVFPFTIRLDPIR